MPTPSRLRGPKSRPLAVEALEDRSVPAFGFGSAFDFGGPLDETLNGIALDAAGNVYLSGNFRDTVDFDPNHTNPASSHVRTAFGTSGESDAFAAKYAADGTFQWVTVLGAGEGNCVATNLAVDGSGVYVPYWSIGSGGLAAKLDPATGAVAWTTTVTANPYGQVWSAAVGPSGAVYVGGETDNSGVPTNQGIVARLDPATGIPVWTRLTAGSSYPGWLAVDGAENVYAAGFFSGTVTFGTTPLTTMSSFAENAFVWKLDAGGNSVWAGRMGSTGGSRIRAIDADAGGNVYVAGRYQAGTTDFDPGPGTATLVNRGGSDVFVEKLVPGANGAMRLGWVKGMGGGGTDNAYGVAVDTAGNVYTTGHFTGTVDFNPNSRVKKDQKNLSGGGVYVSKLDANGNYADAAGMAGTADGTGLGDGTNIAIDGANNVYVAGMFTGTADFNPTAGTFNLTPNGGRDVFVVKLTQSGSFAAAGAPETKPTTWAVDIDPPRVATAFLAPATDGFAIPRSNAPPAAIGTSYLPPAIEGFADQADDFAPIHVIGGRANRTLG